MKNKKTELWKRGVEEPFLWGRGERGVQPVKESGNITMIIQLIAFLLSHFFIQPPDLELINELSNTELTGKLQRRE